MICVWWLVAILGFSEIMFGVIALNVKVASWERLKHQELIEKQNKESVAPVVHKKTVIPVRPRSVEELLSTLSPMDDVEAGSNNKKGDDDKAPFAPLAPLDDLMTFEDSGKGGGLIETGEDELDKLIREARTAQIEGDMRKAILKLEEASSRHENHPAVLYYFGLTYEMLLNAAKARDYYLKVFQLRDNAGPFYAEAAKKLQLGFSLADDMRGKMSFGPIQVFHDPDKAAGQIVVLTIPVRMAPGVSIRPEDLYIPVQFFDIINDREIALTRSEAPSITWDNPAPDWKNGEEIMKVKYFMPTLSSEEIMALGDVRYYGYTAKLYYKGEPMDCKSTPNSLILVEQKKKFAGFGADDDGSLLPPIEAEPASDHVIPAYDDDSASESVLPPVLPQ